LDLESPALTIAGVDPDLALAVVDDFSPAAAEDRADGFTIFFRERAVRDRAAAAVAQAFPGARLVSREIDDEDWGRRSQQNLKPITVGHLTISPAPDPKVSPLHIVIQPSIGFGTGHHATTRLCLRALQEMDLTGAEVLDVGTGSGILAIAARRLGAKRARGIDNDPDAIHAARENLALNPDVTQVTFEVADVLSGFSQTFDVVTANLTGTLLIRASRLLGTVRPSGRLVVSGVLDTERDAVVSAFRPAEIVWEARESEWAAVVFRPT
jgi:ribosomal protein L11 methyltransferase